MRILKDVCVVVPVVLVTAAAVVTVGALIGLSTWEVL